MEKKTPANELNESAEKLIATGVTKRADYEAALPLMFALQEKAKSIRKFAGILDDAAGRLSNLAADYAIDHATGLDSPLATVKENIQNGDVTVGGTLYRLTVSPNDPKRMDGGHLTQDFLKSLPKEWTSQKLTLRKSAFAKVSADDLEKHNLRRETKRVWSLPDDTKPSAE